MRITRRSNGLSNLSLFVQLRSTKTASFASRCARRYMYLDNQELDE